MSKQYVKQPSVQCWIQRKRTKQEFADPAEVSSDPGSQAESNRDTRLKVRRDRLCTRGTDALTHVCGGIRVAREEQDEILQGAIDISYNKT
ncbi:hypothetical protein NQZ68_011549 [Dissostichus eleginoides]|nr:hypothetical protein NQZ68_011549 [Dissostichus eleginoides]